MSIEHRSGQGVFQGDDLSLFRRIFDSRARQAEDAEAEGDLRRAAHLWTHMGYPMRAVELLKRLGETSKNLEERVQAWVDALQLVPPEQEVIRREIDTKIGLAVLDFAKERGAVSVDAKRRLADAAQRLEKAEKWSEAGDAFELLGRTDDLARCLENAGDIERLERVLEESHAKEHRAARLRRLMSEHEMAMGVGARDVARRALHEAHLLAPGDPSVLDSLRRIEEKWPRRRGLRLLVGDSRVTLVSRLPAVVGRAEADIVIRGASISRKHCEIDRRNAQVIVRDLGSRNGTLIDGVPFAGEIALTGPSEIGLGEDVAVRVSPEEHGVELEIVRGLERGDKIIVGESGLRVKGLGASFVFVEDRIVLEPDRGVSLLLFGKSIAAAIDLLNGDSLMVGGIRVEVLS